MASRSGGGGGRGGRNNEDDNEEIKDLDQRVWDTVCDSFRNGVVDFQASRFKLRSLNGLGKLCKDSGITPTAVLLKENALDSLVELEKYYSSLKTIDASNNRIEYLCVSPEKKLHGWSKRMKMLTNLDLSFNVLTSIPDLSNMPNLQKLNLSNNHIISDDSFAHLKKGENLVELNLTSNNLSWDSKEQFVLDTKVFRVLGKLETLRMSSNPFVRRFEDYHIVILAHIRSRFFRKQRKIKTIDGYVITSDLIETAENMRKKGGFGDGAGGPAEDDGLSGAGGSSLLSSGLMSPEEQADMIEEGDGEDAYLGGDSDVLGGDQVLSQRVSGLVPKLTELSAWLEECFVHPSRCLQILGEMTRDVHDISDRPQDHKALFKIDTDQPVDLAIDEFLQNVVLLSERQPQIIHSLLRILVYLSTVMEENLGPRCVQQLKDLMSGGEHNAVTVIQVINDFMMPLLDRTHSQKIRDVICQNLIVLAVAGTHIEGLNVTPLDNAIPFICAHIVRSRGPGAPSDVVLEMAAVASKMKRLVPELGHPTVAQAICRELIEANVGTKRYLSLLIIVQNLAQLDLAPLNNGGPERNRLALTVDKLEEYQKYHKGNLVHRSALLFAKENIHQEILRNLKLIVGDREVANGSRNFDEMIHASLLAINSLCLVRSAFIDVMVNRQGYENLLFQLYGSPKAGPVILSAVLTCLTGILTTPRAWFPLRFDDSVLDYSRLFESITRRLQKVVPLLQYLGEKGTKFGPMCNLIPESEKALYSRSDRKTIANLHAPSMHELLVAVIDLITVYNKEANRSDNPLAVRVTKELNQNKRETFLFACLNTPSDDVRLAVVRCLLEIQLSEFDHQEINYLVELLSNAMNISSGKTEEVIGGAFLLLTRLCMEPDTEGGAGASFRSNFAEKSAAAAFSILERNEKRDTHGQTSESQEKRILSTACVKFIQACSLWKSLKNFLRSHDVLEKMIQILYIEDLNSGYVKLNPRNDGDVSRTDYVPNLIERTLCGRQVEYLLRTLIGVRAVNPSRAIAPRIMRRIADVLTGIPDPSIEMVRIGWGFESTNDVKLLTNKKDGDAQGNNNDDDDDVNHAGDDEEEESLENEQPQLENGGVRDGYKNDDKKNIIMTSNERDFHEEKKEYSVHILQHMKECTDPSLDFRSLTNLQTQREKHMPGLWSILMGPQTGCVGNWVDSGYLPPDEKTEMLQQHQLLIHFSGMERLLLFLVGAMEKSLEYDDGSSAMNFANGGDGTAANAPSGATISQLLNAFTVPNIRESLERIVLRLDATSENHLEASKTIQRAIQGTNTLTGKQVLIRCFMKESVHKSNQEQLEQLQPAGPASSQQPTPPRPPQGSTESTDLDFDAGFEDETSFGDEYPGADRVMFIPSVANRIRRDSEITDTLVAGLRVIYCLLRFGSIETTTIAKKILRVPAKLKILACICTGSRARPVWPQALIGAKFMAIAYEVLVIPGIRREIDPATLDLYAIVCASASRIVSTLRFFIESGETHQLSKADLVTAVHTTRTLLLIAKQFQHLRMPFATSKTISEHTRHTGLSAIWNELMPFQSTIKGLIALLIACSNKYSQSSLPIVDYCVREHVIEFLVLAFNVSANSRYEVLEQLVRTQIHDRTSFRASFIQELLNRVAYSSFETALFQYMNDTIFIHSSAEPGGLEGIQSGGKSSSALTGIDGPQGDNKVMIEEKKIKAEEDSSSGGGGGAFASFFAACAGSRPKGPPKPKALKTEVFIDSQGTVRKTWAVEPPPALTYSSLTNNDVERQSWEMDRIGKERILVSAFMDAYESGTRPYRKLVVLTSEAYYLFEPNDLDKGWQVLKDDADIFTNPVLFAQTKLFADPALKPQLVWRKPYRALERIILGLYGASVHLLHRESDLPGKNKPITLTLVTYISGVATKLYSTFMQMCREWAQIEQALGAQPSLINVPPYEKDVTCRDAVRGVLEKVESAESVIDFEIPGNASHHGNSSTSKNKENDRENAKSYNRFFEFAESTCLYNRLQGAVFTPVLQIKGGQGEMVPRVIFATGKHFAILEAHWEHWTFPSDFAAQRKKLLRTVNLRSSAQDEGSKARTIASMNAHIQQKIDKENMQRKKVLTLDTNSARRIGRKWAQHPMVELNEVSISKGEEPILDIGFGKKTSSNPDKEPTSSITYKFLFYDHQSREDWISQLTSRSALVKI